MKKDPVLLKIRELIPLAPADWAGSVAKGMGKSEESIYAYCRGTRGLKKGMHREVLKRLKKLADKEQAEIKKILEG